VGTALVLALLNGCVVPGAGFRPKQPELSSSLEKGSVQVGELTRTYVSYTPQTLPDDAPLLVVLHGSTQTGGTIRAKTGYEFDRLADKNRFLVVYPNGYMKHWNDCRKKASYTARRRNIDDKAFLQALIDQFAIERRIDTNRVYAVGFSNGGHMAYRLALEEPERFASVAAIAANLPTDENCDCTKSDDPIPVLILNGTKDPINPHEGGAVTIFGFASRGQVLSASESAAYFARINGHTEPPAKESFQGAEFTRWQSRDNPEVLLISVEGGGHAVPQPTYTAPFLMGRTVKTINGPELVWDFFERQTPRE
jgi:polyhydroxybutyrate depolymerase